jgi:uncharacterized membrane protein YidH (DUF202 family)
VTGVPGGEGLQPERTALAWQRTAIGAVVVLLPLLLVDARLGAWPLVLLGSLSSVVAAVLVGRTAQRFRDLHHHRHLHHHLDLHDHRDLHHHDRPAGAGNSPWPPMRAVALVVSLAAGGAVATALTLVLS